MFWDGQEDVRARNVLKKAKKKRERTYRSLFADRKQKLTSKAPRFPLSAAAARDAAVSNEAPEQNRRVPLTYWIVWCSCSSRSSGSFVLMHSLLPPPSPYVIFFSLFYHLAWVHLSRPEAWQLNKLDDGVDQRLHGKHQVGGDRWPDGTMTKSCVCQFIFLFFLFFSAERHRLIWANIRLESFRGNFCLKEISPVMASVWETKRSNQSAEHAEWLFMTCICSPCDDLLNLIQHLAPESAVDATTQCKKFASSGAEIFPVRESRRKLAQVAH